MNPTKDCARRLSKISSTSGRMICVVKQNYPLRPSVRKKHMQ